MKPTAIFPVLAALLFAASATLLPAQAQADKSERQKVVFQVSDNDPAKWNLALNNARNVQVDLGQDNGDVEIVAPVASVTGGDANPSLPDDPPDGAVVANGDSNDDGAPASPDAPVPAVEGRKATNSACTTRTTSSGR